MARELTRDELHELLAAYALDAIEGDEREQVERYLERDPQARARVSEYRETAALLGNRGGEAPETLWSRIEHTLGDSAPPIPIARRRLPVTRRRLAVRGALAFAAAAAIAVFATLGVELARQNHRLDELEQAQNGSLRRQAEIARRSPDARTVLLTSRAGDREARVVVLPDGDGYLLDDNLDRLPSKRTYQLWALVGSRQSSTMISAGVLGPDPNVSAFRVHGPVIGFVITEERAGGVDATSNPAVVQGRL
jgi:anti-sigma factor RsiW